MAFADMNVQAELSLYSQLSPCGHPAMMDIQYGQQLNLGNINWSRYYGVSLMKTLTQGPNSVRYKGSWL